jgi:hypothetical protein
MAKNLFKPEWAALESDDLRVLLQQRLGGGPGQLSGKAGEGNQIFLPLADNTCRLALRFKGNAISAVERGPAFDAAEWAEISATIEALLRTEPDKVGRDIAFSAFRVTGWWRGIRSGVQILPPPPNAPIVPSGVGEHPFVLEFPLHSDSDALVMNLRRRREHRKLTLLLNVLLMGRVNSEPLQNEHAWACLGIEGTQFNCQWLQLSYFADIGRIITDVHSASVGDQLEVLAPEAYYELAGHDGKPLRVPSDLDESICRYRELRPEHREKFDRALLWFGLASRHWTTSMSSSFASLVSAIESLTERGSIHHVYCDKCGRARAHDAPGPTEQFRNFFETYAPGVSLEKRRKEMYDLRSDIVHGSNLISFDEGRAFGWDPPWFNQKNLHKELWSITRIALRNYLINPGAATDAGQSVQGGDTPLRRDVAFLVAGALAGALLGAGACALLRQHAVR